MRFRYNGYGKINIQPFIVHRFQGFDRRSTWSAFDELLLGTAFSLVALLFQSLHFFLTLLESSSHKNLLQQQI